MTRSTKVRLMACTAVLCLLTGLGIWFVRDSKPPVPTMDELLYLTQSGRPMRLYSGAVDPATGQPLTPMDRSYDIVAPGGIKVASFILNKDGTSKDIYYQGNGVGVTFVKEYYALLPRDDVRRPKGVTFIAADGKTVKSEVWWRLNGTREKAGQLLAGDAKYETTVLFADGITAQSMQLTEPYPYAAGVVPKLFQEKRWHDDIKHTLAYLDQLNEDGTRDQSTFDLQSMPLMVKHIGRWGNSGTTVKFFHPGTDKVRLESSSDYSVTSVKVYRLDGTLSWMQTLSSYRASALYFDATGKTPIFEQVRWKTDVTVAGKTVSEWQLWQVTEYTADKKDSRVFTWRDGKIATITRFKFTVDGVTYDKVIWTYRAADGTLEKVEMLGPKALKRVVEHTAAENLRATIPAQFTKAQEFFPEIPIPEAQVYYGGYP